MNEFMGEKKDSPEDPSTNVLRGFGLVEKEIYA